MKVVFVKNIKGKKIFCVYYFGFIRIIFIRVLIFGSCVLQQFDVGMFIELLVIQLLFFKI